MKNNLENKRKSIIKVLGILKKLAKNLPEPLANLIVKDYGKDPYLILISCLLSLRSRDSVTYKVCKKLFEHVKTPQQMVKIDLSDLQELIHSINYYKNKAKTLKYVSNELIKRFKGTVPNNKKDLLSIKGIGLKTANLVLYFAYDIPEIIVDTHVQKLSNLLGWVHTQKPEDTEKELKEIVPQKYWPDINYYLVIWGQNFNKPIFKIHNKELLAYKVSN